MKTKLSSIVLTVFILYTSALSVNAASYFYDDGSNNDNPNIDKFKPSSGVKIKESGMARMMENATRNAMDSSQGKQQKRNVQNMQKTKQVNQETTNPYQRSYKWF